MHLIPLLRCPSTPSAARQALAALAEAGLPASIALPAPLAAGLDPELARDLAAGPFEWVRTGYTEPWFAMLPEAEIQRQIVREETALRGAGLEPGPLLLETPWARHLPSSLARAGITALLLPADGLDRTSTGVVSHLDAVLPVVPVVDLAVLDELDGARDDAVAVLVDADAPVDRIRQLVRRTSCDVTSVAAHLTSHPPLGRRRPEAPDWEQRLAEDVDRGVLHRRLVGLVARLPDRLSDEAELALLEAEAGAGFSSLDPVEAGSAMVAARRRIEAERRRGDDWVSVHRSDWDADGRLEIHVELADLSLVLAPARSGALPVLDHKPSAWPVSTVAGEPGSALVRFVGDLRAGDPVPVELAETSVTEMRGGIVAVALNGRLGGGELDVTLEARQSTLTLRYEPRSMPQGVLGPELKVAFDPGARCRVDGSEWQPVDRPRAVAGHRFRVASGERQVLISSLTPASLFLRPGIEGSGIVAWPHWAIAGTGVYEMTVELLA